MPNHRTAFPHGIPVPSDPDVPLTPEQLAALFPSREANQRFVSMLISGVEQSYPTPELAPVPNGTSNGG